MTDAFMKVVCRDARRAQRLRASTAARPRRRSTPRRSRARGRGEGRAASRSPSSARARTRSCSSPRPSACCSSSSAALALQRPRPRRGPRRARRPARHARRAPRDRRSPTTPRRARDAAARLRHRGRPEGAGRAHRGRRRRRRRPRPALGRARRRRRALDRPRDSRPAARRWGPSPTNLVLRGGGAADVAELASPIERGIYVTRLWYVNTVREKETLLTGMTRDGTFLIEDGAHHAPAARRALHRLGPAPARARPRRSTTQQRLVTEGEFYGRRFAHGVVCPALRADGFRVTGVDDRARALELQQDDRVQRRTRSRSRPSSG